ncbi:MAG: MBL fold metallo-hydrolase, partial [Firmicutes bacterium]|nr:MBL fold metallo-hydrolase [Bacillota bacterium]
MNKISINTQSSIKIEGSKTVYIDPFKRSEKTCDADIIFITHGHYDHFDEKSIRKAAGKDAVIVCPDSMLDEVSALGISETVTGMEPGEEVEISGIKVEAVPAYNKDKQFHPKENGWLGYIITLDGVKYYVAGDTDALDELAGIECDVAMVPIGGKYTMTAEEAAGLINRIKPEYAVPTHYGTIVGSPEDADVFESNVDEGIKVV